MIEEYIEFHAADFLMYSAELTNEETGILITKICLAVVKRDSEYLSMFSFLGEIKTRVVGNRPAIPKWMREQIMERDHFKCQKCGNQMWLQIDHIVPYSIIGRHSIENLQILCKSCNMKKSNKYDGPLPAPDLW